MLYKSTAFAGVSLLLFFFSIIYATGATSRRDTARDSARKLATLLTIDALALYLLLASRTATGINDQDTVITMTAAGFANALYAVSTEAAVRVPVPAPAPATPRAVGHDE